MKMPPHRRHFHLAATFVLIYDLYWIRKMLLIKSSIFHFRYKLMNIFTVEVDRAEDKGYVYKDKTNKKEQAYLYVWFTIN
jgi:hypothetical protein